MIHVCQVKSFSSEPLEELKFTNTRRASAQNDSLELQPKVSTTSPTAPVTLTVHTQVSFPLTDTLLDRVRLRHVVVRGQWGGAERSVNNETESSAEVRGFIKEHLYL